MALLKERGIAALTQPQVAAAAGVKQSHLTYFPTRADLLLGIAEASIESTMADLAQRLEKRRAVRRMRRQPTLAATVAEVMIAGIPPRVIIGRLSPPMPIRKFTTSLRRFIAQIRVRIQFMLDKAGARRPRAGAAVSRHRGRTGGDASGASGRQLGRARSAKGRRHEGYVGAAGRNVEMGESAA